MFVFIVQAVIFIQIKYFAFIYPKIVIVSHSKAIILELSLLRDITKYK